MISKQREIEKLKNCLENFNWTLQELEKSSNADKISQKGITSIEQN